MHTKVRLSGVVTILCLATGMAFASGNSPVGIGRIEIWIDGVKRAQALNDQIRKQVTLAAGSHRLTVVAVDRYEGISKTTKTISVP